MLIQYKCMPLLPPTRFYRLGALRKDWAEITCALSSLSMPLFLCSRQNIFCMLHFIQRVFGPFSFPPLSYSYKCKSQAKTHKVKKICQGNKTANFCRAVEIIFPKKKPTLIRDSQEVHKILHLIIMTSVQDVLL